MNDPVTLRLLPLDQTLQIQRGTELQDVLFEHGVEFPCGGRGRCKGCRIRIVSGSLAITVEDRRKLTAAELQQGWRLACRARAEQDLTIELAQWETPILSDDTGFDFIPRPGLGVAIDLGTTTIVAQLVDLQNGHVLAVRSALNAQARHGADIMSRIEFAMAGDGQKALQNLVRRQIGELLCELVGAARATQVVRVVLVGNTAMHHLFSGISVEPLSHFPFEPAAPGLQFFNARGIGW
ncbi:MAG TPA: 2Fe-2S iron-sulfur cluster-binding protein, partial [Clostridia bacterium]|nr:2Fe-2S iron-sulfur cluster-binding protein [Clostridia bacterium]